MASNKYILMLGLISLFSSAAFAQQSDAGYDWRDSSKISTRNLPQQSEFLNNQYPYPAKPRSQWELGFAGGNNMVIGDIKPKADVGGAITLRKALSHTFSLRGGWFGGYSQGYPNVPQRQTQPAVRSFQNWKHSLALDLITSLN